MSHRRNAMNPDRVHAQWSKDVSKFNRGVYFWSTSFTVDDVFWGGLFLGPIVYRYKFVTFNYLRTSEEFIKLLRVSFANRFRIVVPVFSFIR